MHRIEGLKNQISILQLRLDKKSEELLGCKAALGSWKKALHQVVETGVDDLRYGVQLPSYLGSVMRNVSADLEGEGHGPAMIESFWETTETLTDILYESLLAKDLVAMLSNSGHTNGHV